MPTHRPLLVLVLLALFGCEGALAIEAASTAGRPERPIIDLEDPPPLGGDAGPRVDAGVGGGVDAGPRVDAGPGCTPACGSRMCGDDGCGGSCGSCGAGESCSAGGTCQGASSMCPPSGNAGTSPGQVAPDFSVPLLGGGEVSVRSLCSAPVAMIYRHSESCGICRRWLETGANALYQDLQAQGFEMIILLGTARNADGSYGPPSAEGAQRLQDTYGLAMPIAYETNNEMLWNLQRSGAGTTLLMTEGNVIAAGIGRVSDSTVRGLF